MNSSYIHKEMQMLSLIKFLHKSCLLYRFIRYRKGFGVHSPFVFNLITKVIEEEYLYYRYSDIELIRKEFSFRDIKISYTDRYNKRQYINRPIGKIIKEKAISPKSGALLFRLTNYYKPKNILQIGAGIGISSLYLTSYSKGLTSIVLESSSEFIPTIRRVFDKAARNTIDLREGNYEELLPKALQDMESLDFVFFNTKDERQNNLQFFNLCLKHKSNDSVFVFDGINSSKEMKSIWKDICKKTEVTVTLDLYDLGIVLFNKRLHKRNYIVYF